MNFAKKQRCAQATAQNRVAQMRFSKMLREMTFMQNAVFSCKNLRLDWRHIHSLDYIQNRLIIIYYSTYTLYNTLKEMFNGHKTYFLLHIAMQTDGENL